MKNVFNSQSINFCKMMQRTSCRDQLNKIVDATDNKFKEYT